jgi:hypothetical protein
VVEIPLKESDFLKWAKIVVIIPTTIPKAESIRTYQKA